MSTKTIAVESSVYERLASAKKPSESFTKAISRVLDATSTQTCAAAVAQAKELWGAADTSADAERLESVVREGRASTDWNVERPS